MAAGAMLPLMLVSTGVSVAGKLMSMGAQEDAIEQQKKEEQLASNKKQVDEDNQMQRLLSLQRVRAAASGFQYSGSFANLTTQTFNDFAEDRNADLLNLHMREGALDAKEDNVFAQGFLSSIGEIGSSAFEYYKLKPEKVGDDSLDPNRFNDEELFS